MSAPTPWAPAWSLHSVKGGDTNLSTWATDRHTDTQEGALLEGGARVRGFIQTLLRHLGDRGVLTISRHTQRAGDRASHSDQPVPLNNQVRKRDKEAQNKKTKPSTRPAPQAPTLRTVTCLHLVSHKGPCQRVNYEVRS